MFRLEPDLLVEHDGRRWVMDTKWKRLDAHDKANKDGLSLPDLYQLFAYGMKYLGQQGGELALIFPKWSKFQSALPAFDFGYGYGRSLRVLPFDLDKETMNDFEKIGLPILHQATGSPELTRTLWPAPAALGGRVLPMAVSAAGGDGR